MVIWRRDERSGAFDTQCLCFFEVTNAEDGWHISAITQDEHERHREREAASSH